MQQYHQLLSFILLILITPWANASDLQMTVPTPTGVLGTVYRWDGLSPILAWGIWVVCAIVGVFLLWRWSRAYSPPGSVAKSEHSDDRQWLNRVLPIVRFYENQGWDFWRKKGIVLFGNELIRFRKRRRRAVDAAYQPEGADELKQTKGIKIKDTFPLELVDDVMIEQPSLLSRIGITIGSGTRSVRVVMREHEIPNFAHALQILLPERVYTGCRISRQIGIFGILVLLTLSLWLPLLLSAQVYIGIGLLFAFIVVGLIMWLSVTAKPPQPREKLKKASEDLSHRRPLRSRPLSFVAKLLAITIIVAYFLSHKADIVSFLTFDTKHTGVIAAAVYFIVGILLQVANGLWQKDPNQMRKTNTFRPIVYLRSFLDDRETSLHPESWFSSIVGLDPPYEGIKVYEGYPFYRMFRKFIRYFYNYHPVRLLKLLFGSPLDTSEQQMASFFAHYGLFVAIGKPGERFATVGASRMYVGNDEWQDIVRGLLKDPQFVLLQPSSTEGVWWEVEQTLKMVKPNHVLICLVNYVGRQNDYESFRLRLERLLPEDTRVPRSIGYNRSITFFRFDSHWQPHEIHLHYYSRFLWPLRFQAVNFMRSLQPFLLECGLVDSDGETRPSVEHQLEPASGNSQYQESRAT